MHDTDDIRVLANNIRADRVTSDIADIGHFNVHCIRSMASAFDQLPDDVLIIVDEMLGERIGPDLDQLTLIIGAAAAGDVDELIANGPGGVR